MARPWLTVLTILVQLNAVSRGFLLKRTEVGFTGPVRNLAMHPRTRQALEALPPEQRAAAEAAITKSAARRATPEGQAEEEEVIRKVRQEFPPLSIDPELAKALSALWAERE